ncbi:MAG TPA: general secretion pathway protein GspB, partial [Pseudoduganella sp.]
CWPGRVNNMSYILEALKKAQAERQIGSTPTIHAPTLASAPAGQGARGNRTPVIVAMALMAAAIAGLATMLVRQQPGASRPPAAASPAGAAAAVTPAATATATPAAASGAPAAAATGAEAADVAPAVAGPPVAGTTPAAAAPTAGDPDAPVASPISSGRTAPAAAGQPGVQRTVPQSPTALAKASARDESASPAQRGASLPAANQRTADARTAQQVAAPTANRTAEAPQLAATKQAGTAARGADIAQAAPVAAPPAAPAPAEEQVQFLRELPEPIQRAIPQITLGGYMYSKNPADRLLLIDKVLRKEGEEVAPGLILDKLQPKQAIFSFRGYRYRVPL